MSASIFVRRLGPEDLQAVHPILRESWGFSYSSTGLLNSLYRLLEDPSLTFLLPGAGETALMAFAGEQPAGVLVTRRPHDIDCILGLYVRPSHHRKGVGLALIRHAVEMLPELSVLEAQVMEASTWALTFYRALGFVEIGRQCLHLADDRAAGVVVMRAKRDHLVANFA